MVITPNQKKVIDSVLSLIETGRLPTPAAYSTATVLGDRAGISYGVHQATDRADSLDDIVIEYITLGGVHAAALQRYLPLLAQNHTAAARPGAIDPETASLVRLLQAAGTDPLMHRAQQAVFDRRYWLPAHDVGVSIGLKLPLSYLVLYDTTVQSGLGGIATTRVRFPEAPPSRGGDERAWCSAYVHARLRQLETWVVPGDAAHTEAIRRSAYRIRAIRDDLLQPWNWNLIAPFRFRGTMVPAV